MDCREFRNIASGQARAQAAGALADAGFLGHAAVCEPCARLLGAEQALAAGFHALKLQDQDLRPPVEQEAELLDQFRVLHPRGPLAAPQAIPHRNHWALPAALAAMAALAVWLGSSWRELALPAGTITMDVPGTMDASDAKDVPADVGIPEPVGAGAAEFAAGAASSRNDPTAALTAPPSAQVPAGAVRAADFPDQTAGAGLGVASAHGEPSSAADAGEAAGSETQAERLDEPPAESPALAQAAPRQEVVTEFLPLTYAGWTTGTPDARLVRVRLPSTALAYFGLSATAGTAPVEADVLLGGDGLARAVRFVRPVMASTQAPVRDAAGPRRRY